MLILQSSRLSIPPPASRYYISHSPKRQLSSCPCWWIKSSILSACNVLMNNEGKRRSSLQRKCSLLDVHTNSDVPDSFSMEDSKRELKNHMLVKTTDHVTEHKKQKDVFSNFLGSLASFCFEGSAAKFTLAIMVSYFILKMAHLNYMTGLINLARNTLKLPAATSLSFACMSSSLNKPKPLGLDVSFPSLQEIKWSFARLVYLFNIQLERNVGTFFIVLLAACSFFVIFGGFIFFRFSYYGITQTQRTISRGLLLGGLGMPNLIILSLETTYQV